MAIAFVAASSSATDVAAIPTGAAAGDVLVGVAIVENSGTIASLPAGWTNVATVNNSSKVTIRVAYRVMVAGDTAPTWTGATTTSMVAYRGANQTSPVGASATASDASGSVVTLPALTLQNTSGSSWVVAGYAHRRTATLTTPTGMVERVDFSDADPQIAASDLASATAFTSRTATADDNAEAVAVAFELRAPTGTAHALNGSSAGLSASTGGLTAGFALAGTSPGSSGSTGDAVVARPLAGTSTGAAASTGAVDVSHPLAGTSAGGSGSTGDLTVTGAGIVALEGTSTGLAGGSGELTVTSPALPPPDVGGGVDVDETSIPDGRVVALEGRSVGSSASFGVLTVTQRPIKPTRGPIFPPRRVASPSPVTVRRELESAGFRVRTAPAPRRLSAEENEEREVVLLIRLGVL